MGNRRKILGKAQIIFASSVREYLKRLGKNSGQANERHVKIASSTTQEQNTNVEQYSNFDVQYPAQQELYEIEGVAPCFTIVQELLEIEGTGPYFAIVHKLQRIEGAGSNLGPYLDFF